MKFREIFIYAEEEAEQSPQQLLLLCHGCRSCCFGPTFDLIYCKSILLGKILIIQPQATKLIPDTAFETRSINSPYNGLALI